MKPIGKAQGKGIFLVNKLNMVTQWQQTASTTSSLNKRLPPPDTQPVVTTSSPDPQPVAVVEPYIIQKYVSSPFLIGGKKFDMRIYVLVTSYRPLTIWL